jgi:transposase
MKDTTPNPQDRLQRWHLLEMVIDGRISLCEASRALQISYRHAKRLKQVVMTKGPQGLVHGNIGKKAYNSLDESLKNRIISLARKRYSTHNNAALTRVLDTEHGIKVSRETVRKIIGSAGIKTSPTKKTEAPLKTHALLPPAGMMVLWGGLTSRWFGRNSPECCFMAAVDVATMQCLAARFFQQEGSIGYLWLLKNIVSNFGLPVSFCQHSASAIKRRDQHWSIEEELRGEQDPTQTARALKDLGIKQYLESKQRVENISSRFKDFLRTCLKRNVTANLEQANGPFIERFIRQFNRRYAAPAKNHAKAWRPVPHDLDVNMICSVRYEAMVDARNQVSIRDVVITIPPGISRISYARAHVEVRQLLDGSWLVFYGGNKIAAHVPTPLLENVYKKQKAGTMSHSPDLYFTMYNTDEQDFY